MSDLATPARKAPVLLLAAAVPVFFLFLGASAIWDANEAFYVETPRQMVQSGDYVNPAFNGHPRFNKPVLSYWIVAGLYRTFGESVAVERAGIAVGAMGILLATFLLGRALGSTTTGVLAALCVATSPRVVMYSRRIFIDVYITMFMALALACFVLAERDPAHRRRYLALMYVAIGLGVLTKGPVALVLPAFVFLAWLLAAGRLRDAPHLMPVTGALIVLAIVVPWYAAVYAQHGWSYIQSFLLDENLARYTTSMAPGDRGPLFYLAVLVGDLFPWSPLILVPLAWTAMRWQSGSTAGGREPLRRLLWLWIVLIVGVFSFSRTKQDLYIFPVVPAVAALVADAFVMTDFGAHSRTLRIGFAVVCAVCLLLAGGLYWVFGPHAGFYALEGAGLFAPILGAAGAVALGCWLRGLRAPAVFALAAGFIGLNYLFVARVLPGLERFKPVPSLARTFADRAGPGANLAYYQMVLPSFVYYANRTIPEINDIDDATAFFAQGRDAWVITGESEWATLRSHVPGLCVAGRRPLFVFDAKLSNILAGVPPPDVLLVTNKCGG